MPIPTYDRFIEPILRFLAKNPAGALARDAYEAAADALGISEQERQELLPSGTQAVYKNRAGWAHDRLKRIGYSSSPRRGFWQLTQEGMQFSARSPRSLSEEQLAEIASGHEDVRLRPDSPKHPQAASVIESNQSPDERLEAAVAEIRAAITAELRDTLSRVSPAFFEAVVLDVLHAIGYGASRSDLQRVGRSGDGGIDGVISLDRLGLEKVYVQAKRWKGSVGRPEIQGFYGALAGQRATKGVFITTSTFTKEALDFARSVEKIVLVDGEQLAGLMVDYEVGISARAIKVPKLDSDYFDE
ncbi:MAG: restriction endonuclease [Polyangiaceae bacterium]|jgi:restriction system protein|nr:restriction endonuclease [Polyangiaceae bacterium]MBK8936996.1 restriction endonuclease [Polyangiaceae bacterium]